MSHSTSTTHQTQTITAAKSAFLRAQTRVLSSPLHYRPESVSTSLPSAADESSLVADATSGDVESGKGRPQQGQQLLPPKVLSDVLTKVNAKIKSHNRLVFSMQSQRHVAEQIDALYWAEVTEALKSVEDDNEINGPVQPNSSSSSAQISRAQTRSRADRTIWIGKEVDLAAHAGVDLVRGLPADLKDLVGAAADTAAPTGGHDRDESETRDDPKDGHDDNDDAEYAKLRRQLLQLAERRDALKRRVNAYRRLHRLLEPFRDASVNVQPNLVTRDGELSRELERMRVLVARVEGGLSIRNQGRGENGIVTTTTDDGDDNEDATPLGHSTHVRYNFTNTSNHDRLASVMELG